MTDRLFSRYRADTNANQSINIVVLGLLLLYPHSRPSLTSRLKIANLASVLWNNLPSDLRHVAHHVTPPILNSPVSDLSTPLSLFLSSLVCIHLGYLRTDISGIDQASSFHLTHISLSLTVISFTPILLYLTCKCL